MNTLKELQGTTAFLNGQEGLHDLDEQLKSALQHLGKPTLVLDNLFEQSEKLLSVTQCKNLAFSTTGMYVDKLKILADVFKQLQYVPETVFFLTEETALTFSSLAGEFKKKGTKFYFPDSIDLLLKKDDVAVYEYSWI